MNFNLHIITLNIPFPPDYGGMIDTYYRIRSLHELGIRIHLHCFEYGRKHPKELESICETINFYPRKPGLAKQFSSVPYIVSSRQSEQLLANLVRNDYPILFDGLHTAYYINHNLLTGRKKTVRVHNIEHNYYKSLSDNERNPLKRFYFLMESAKLRKFEKILKVADHIFPLSFNDQFYFNNRYQNSVYIAPFHPFKEPISLTGTGEYVIYHGDLSVNENALISDLLISNVFSAIPYKCVIAGKDPPEHLKLKAASYPNVTLISNPDNDQMTELIINAQINLLPAIASNGFKIKFLMALFAGRHCIVNSVIGENTLLKNLCHIADSDYEIIRKIHSLMNIPFTEELISERQKILTENFDIRRNAQKLIKLIF
jgi:hypothetical protein